MDDLPWQMDVQYLLWLFSKHRSARACTRAHYLISDLKQLVPVLVPH
jgi:hypothetical protein